MHKTRVGVLRGGPSSEYDISLITGASVLKNLSEKHSPHDILITKDGVWHFEGLPITPERLARKVDVVFNAMHGEYGEDGTVQKILENHSIPYTGSGVLASAIGMNKVLSKKVYASYGLKTPHHILISNEGDIERNIVEGFRRIPMPVVVKPVSTGSSVGVSIARNFHDFRDAVLNALNYGPVALVEEYIKGREATCGVVENFRGEKVYSLLPIEIKDLSKGAIWDYKSKYSNDLHELICPGNFSRDEKETIQKVAAQAHTALGLEHYSRSDFIVHPKRGVYILETNTLPGLTPTSLMPKGLEAIGCSMPQFLDHLITLALERK